MIKKAVQWIFNRAGYEVVRRGAFLPIERRAETIYELIEMFRHFVFPELIPRDGRAELMARLEGTQSSEATYIVGYLQQSLARNGDVCEFGVAQGATSTLMANEIGSSGKLIWLFDSFEGLPRPTDKDVLIDDIFKLGSMGAYEGTMAFGKDHVLGRLSSIGFPLDRVRIVPGFIETTIKSADLPREVCFAYVDFDFYEPIRTALEFLDGVVPVGGHVIVDDYGWFSAGAQAAVDEFVAARHDRWGFIHPPRFAGHFAVLKRYGRGS